MVTWDQLDNVQRDAIVSIEQSNKHCIWIEGFAGSGKTLILVNLIKRAIANGESVCFISYTHALKDLVLTGFTNAEINKITISTVWNFINSIHSSSFDWIFLDETQDIERNELDNINVRAKKHLILAGDPNQSIYKNKILENELREFPDELPIVLKKVYRLTEKIKKVATVIYPKSNILASQTPPINSTLKRGSDVFYFKASSPFEEVQFVKSKVDDTAAPGKPCLILLPSHETIRLFLEYYFKIIDFNFLVPVNERIDYDLFNDFCSKYSLNIRYFGNSHGDLSLSDTKPMVYFMTYHSAKGLDFDTVMMPFLDCETVNKGLKMIVGSDHDLFNRIMYVATTRSRYDLILSYNTDYPVPFVTELQKKGLLSKMAKTDESDFDDENSDDELF